MTSQDFLPQGGSLLAGTTTERAALAQQASATAVVPHTSIHWVEANGINVFYREAGAPDAPVVLLLHGFPTSSFMYRELIPRLADRYRVIAPDLPGFGFTEVPAERKFIYSFDALAQTILAFVDALQIKRYALCVFDYAEAFKRDIPGADVRFFDTGHFALETHGPEIAAAVRDFLDRKLRLRSSGA